MTENGFSKLLGLQQATYIHIYIYIPFNVVRGVVSSHFKRKGPTAGLNGAERVRICRPCALRKRSSSTASQEGFLGSGLPDSAGLSQDKLWAELLSVSGLGLAFWVGPF